jgi:hypothetical protein
MRAAVACVGIIGTLAVLGCHSGSSGNDTAPGCDAAPTETESWGSGCAHGVDHFFDNGNGKMEACSSGWLAGSFLADCDITVTHVEISGAGGEYAILANGNFAPGKTLWHGSLPGDWHSALGCFSFTVDPPFTLHAGDIFWLASYGQRLCLTEDPDVPGVDIFDGESADGPWSNPSPAGSEWAFPLRLRGDDSYDASPPIDAPPLTCTILSDSCFAQYAAELQAAQTCMAHPDTCAASGNTDASGCGHESRNPDGSENCSWPDGAHQDATLSATSLSFVGINAKGQTCFTAASSDAGSANTTTTFSFPDGKKFVVHASSTPTPSTTIDCPDGTTSRSFTHADAAVCKVGLTCCSPSCS